MVPDECLEDVSQTMVSVTIDSGQEIWRGGAGIQSKSWV